MAQQKIFAGPRIRRIRNDLELTQAAMAEALGISASYLNLIERNQRPLTVQLMMQLSSVYGINADRLANPNDAVVASLREVFADPLLADEIPNADELVEFADATPNVASAFVKLYRAYSERAQRLSDLTGVLAREGSAGAGVAMKQLPADEVHDVLAARPNHFPDIEEEADAFLKLLDAGEDLSGALKEWLRAQHGIVVRTLPISAMPDLRRRYDRHSQRLFLSERLSPFDQSREIAYEAALLRMQVVIGAAIQELKLTSDEARRIARFELGRYAAHALMMPYQRFLEAAQRARYDIDVLRSRFGVSFEQAANRLTMLTRDGKSGIPFFMLEIDQAGNRFRRAGAQGFPQARFGGQCPKLPIHAAFTQPGQIFAEKVELPDGAEFLVIARTLEGPQAAFNERVRRTAMLLGCDAGFAADTVYGAALQGKGQSPTLVGPACRLCDRKGCLSRAEPPVTRPLGLDEMVTGLSAFDFQ